MSALPGAEKGVPADHPFNVPNPPTPLDVMMAQLNSSSGTGGPTVTVKRRCVDGSLVDASPNQLSTLSTKSRVVTAAQALKDLPPNERTAWAIEMKDYANELYATNQTRDAMEKYVEALAASDFGSSSENVGSSTSASTSNTCDNIDVLIIPILCNLASCCIRLEEFSKALAFAEQALKLRPCCGKALMRAGIALLHHGEYSRAIASLTRSMEVVEDTPGAVLIVGEEDRQRIPILLGRARQGLESEQKAVAKQKRSLERHFNRPKAVTSPSVASKNSNESSTVETNVSILLLLWQWVLNIVALFISRLTSSSSAKAKSE